MPGINLTDLKYQVVEPALSVIGLNTLAALNLVVGTAVAESSASFLVQSGGGPALGLWQMEPATEQDIWDNFFFYNPTMANQVQSMMAPGATTPQLVWNLLYGASMCRVKFWRSPTLLPAYNDASGMANFWKSAYNTSLGIGSVDTAHIAMFQSAIDA